MSSDEVAKETFSFIFRTAKKAPKLFRTIKEAIELINNFSEVQRKNELNNFNKKVNWNEFSYSEKNAADLNILKEAMKNSSVDYSIFKGKEHIDGTADYILKFSAKDLDAIKKALKEFSSKFAKMDEKSFDKKFARAEKNAEQKNKARTRNKEQAVKKSKSNNLNL